jgi:hypothetical protein
VDRTGAGRADTDSQTAAQLGLCRCGECARLLVSHLNEVDRLRVPDSLDEVIDGVSWDAKELLYAGSFEQLKNEFARVH